MRKWVVALVLLVAVGGVAFYASQNSTSSHVNAPRFVSVTYKVHGTAHTTSITYTTSSGTSQQTDVDVPLTKKSDHSDGIVTQLQAGAFVYLSAQNGEDSGDIECIIEDASGGVIADNKASGGFAIASCSGTAR